MPDSNITSGARRTIALLRSLCEEVGLPPDRFIRRLRNGFGRYGADNHLSADFDLPGEWNPETEDEVCFAAVAVSRGMVKRNDPALLAYMRAVKRVVETQAIMLQQREADGPDWDCYAKCDPCAGQCVTE